MFSEQFCTELDVVDVQSQRIDRFGVCMRGTGGEREKERERGREGEKERKREKERLHTSQVVASIASPLLMSSPHISIVLILLLDLAFCR